MPITRGGRDHTSHRLVALGYTRREAVLILYLASAMLGIAALIVMQAQPLEAYLVGLLVAGAGGGPLLAPGTGSAD